MDSAIDPQQLIRFLQDYSLRAKDYNEKKARLKILRQKAAERNPDEFNYGMLSSKSKKGRKLADRGNPQLSNEAVKLLKTQDSGYLQTIIQRTRRAIAKLEQEIVLKKDRSVDTLGGRENGRTNKRVLFAEDKEEQERYQDRRPNISGATSELRPRLAADGSIDEDGSEPEPAVTKSCRVMEKEASARRAEQLLRKKHKKEQDGRRLKLAALTTRLKDLRDAETELESQRAKMANSIGGVTKNGVKWRPRERRK